MQYKIQAECPFIFGFLANCVHKQTTMLKKTQLNFIFLVFSFLASTPTIAIADATPKPHVKFSLYNEQGDPVDIENMLLLQWNNGDSIPDSICYNKNDDPCGSWGYISVKGNEARVMSYGFRQNQKVIISTSAGTYTSETYDRPKWHNPSIQMVIKDNGNLEVKQSLAVYAKRSFWELLVALIITLFVEGLVAITWGKQNSALLLKPLIKVNLISVPILWIGFRIAFLLIDLPYPIRHIYIAEILVVILEIFLYLKFLKSMRSTAFVITFSLVANLLSFLVGLFVFGALMIFGIF